jgi:hypothetical protein
MLGFDLTDLEWRLRLFAVSRLGTASAVAAAVAASMAVGGVVYLWHGKQQIPADAVTVSGPVFKPVMLAPPAPVPAINPGRPKDSFATAPTDNSALIRSIQRLLAGARCYAGPSNGIWTPATRRGMAEFTSLVNARLPLDRPAPELLSLLEANGGTVCGSGCSEGSGKGCAPLPVPPARRGDVASIEKEPASETRDTAGPLPFADQPGAQKAASADIGETGAMPPDAAGEQKNDAAEPRRTHRRYQANSLSRQVSKGFRQIQRTFKSILW